jgi:hypothetical protein
MLHFDDRVFQGQMVETIKAGQWEHADSTAKSLPLDERPCIASALN